MLAFSNNKAGLFQLHFSNKTPGALKRAKFLNRDFRTYSLSQTIHENIQLMKKKQLRKFRKKGMNEGHIPKFLLHGKNI